MTRQEARAVIDGGKSSNAERCAALKVLQDYCAARHKVFDETQQARRQRVTDQP